MAREIDYAGWVGTEVEGPNLIPIETDPLIEYIIGEEMAMILYDKWDAKKWGPPLDFGGNVWGILPAMVLEIPEAELAAIPGIGNKLAQGIRDSCTRAMELEPFH